MKKTITTTDQNNTLEKLANIIKQKTDFTTDIVYNIWDVQTGSTMRKCVLVKKNAVHGVKLDFISENTLNIEGIVPSNFFRSFTIGRGISKPIIRGILAKGQNGLVNEIYKHLQ